MMFTIVILRAKCSCLINDDFNMTDKAAQNKYDM